MYMNGLSGTAFMGYMSGMDALQQRKDISQQAMILEKSGNASGLVFAEMLKSTGVQGADSAYATTEEYLSHLKEKYGNIRLETVGRDQKSLERIAGTMRGDDVIIAPNMLDKMAKDQELASKIEGYIDKAFAQIPKEQAWCSSRGLVYDFEGVIVHEDGTVTVICGCSDSPERIAEVEREHKEKRDKEAANRKAAVERRREEADRHRQLEEAAMKQRNRISHIWEITNNTLPGSSGGDASSFSCNVDCVSEVESMDMGVSV